METGILNIHTQDSSVKELLDTISREYAPLITAKYISWSCTCEPSLFALFDLKWTAKALGNIADSGMGIPEEEQSRSFACFYRSPAVSDRPGDF